MADFYISISAIHAAKMHYFGCILHVIRLAVVVVKLSFLTSSHTNVSLSCYFAQIVNGRLIFVEVAKSRSPGTDASP